MSHHKHRIRGSSRIGRVGPGKQRGVALIFTAFILLALVAALGLAIDVGRLYAAQQNLQTAADVAALETARFVGGCRISEDSLQQIAQRSVNRNFGVAPGDVNTPTVAIPQTGIVEVDDGIQQLVPTPPNTRASAVAVSVTNDFEPIFLALLGGTDDLIATAAATNRPTAQFSIGSTLAEIEPGLLGELLNIDLSAFDKGDLANADISLGDLLNVDAGVVTRDQLLETSLYEALDNIGNSVSGPVADIANQIAMLIPDDAAQASLLDILDIGGGLTSDLPIAAGAIVNAAAQLAAANRDAVISRNINLSTPLVGGAEVIVRILEPPKITMGAPGIDPQGSYENGFPPYYTQAQSTQIGLEIVLDLLNIRLGLVNVNLADLPLAISGARALGGLSSIECARGDQPFHNVSLDTLSEDLRIGIGRFEVNGNGRREFVSTTAKILDVNLLGLGLIGVELSADSQLGVDQGPVDFDPVADKAADLPQSQQFGGPPVDTAYILDVLSNLNLNPQVVGLPIPVSSILNPIQNVLSGPLTTLLTPVLDPLLSQLGVSLGTGEAQLLNVTVDQTRLFCSQNCIIAAPGG